MADEDEDAYMARQSRAQMDALYDEYLAARGGVPSVQAAPQRAGILDVGGIGQRLGLLNQIFNPVEAIGQSMNAGGRMMSPNMGVMDRLAALGDMASGIAGVVAPVAAASRAGTPAATALMEGLLGGSPTQQAAADMARGFVTDEYGGVPILGAGLPPMRPTEEILDLPDNEFVTLYHGTTREAAEKIRQTGKLKSAGEPSVYLTTDPSGAGYGDGTVVPVRVQRGLLQIDDEFPSGRTDFRIDLSRPGGSVPVQIAEAAQTPSLPAPRTDAEAMARDILQLRAEGRAGEVTDQMRAAADPQYMYFNTPLPMDYASRMARADQYFPDTAYHSTGKNFQEFIPSEFRGASFFGPTPEGAARGASASANEGVGSGSTITMPVRVDTSRVEGLGAYGRQDMNEFRASLPDRIYTEAEVDALMASDMAPRYGNWTYFFDDLTDYDALSKFRDANPDAPIPEGIIKYKPKQPLSYGPGLRSDISGKQFAHYSEGMSERPISDYTKSIGNTGFTMQDESGLALAMTDPTRIRSRFALFDPEFRNLSNLSASLAAAGVPLGLLAMLPEEEQY